MSFFVITMAMVMDDSLKYFLIYEEIKIIIIIGI